MEYELQDIRSFVKIAELGSFHEAAEVLHISQPALTRRIKKLEQGLGTSLLDRTTRRVSLTSVGRDFFPKARRLLDDFEDSPEVMQSGLYKHIYTAEYGQFGGQPVAAVIANYYLSPSAPPLCGPMMFGHQRNRAKLSVRRVAKA